MPLKRKSKRNQNDYYDSCNKQCDSSNARTETNQSSKQRSNMIENAIVITKSQPLMEPPRNFSFRPEEWPLWRIRFERFLLASGLSEETESKKINSLIYTLGERAEDIYSSFTLENESHLTLNAVLDLFEKHFVPRKNLIFERAKFLRRSQRSGEPVEDFIVSLRSLARTCEWGPINDDMILMILILGLRDDKLSDRLLLDPEMNLNKAITSIRHTEEVKKEKACLNEPKDVTIDVVKPKNTFSQPNTFSDNYMQEWKNNKRGNEFPETCPWCGYKPSHPRSKCPAKNATCNVCKKIGHFSKVCRSKHMHEVCQENEVSELTSSKKKLFVGSLTKSTNYKPWKVIVNFEGKPLAFKIDSGADVTVVPPGIVPLNRVHPTMVELYGAGGVKLETLGCIQGSLTYNGVHITHPIYIVKGINTPLLGRPAIQDLKILNFVNSVTRRHSNFFTEYHELFNGLGVIPDPYTIELKDKTKPYAITTPRSVPLPLLNTVQTELDNMVKNGVISRVEHATEWCSPMVVVPKHNGTVRICVDLTKLNECVQRSYHPIPKIETSLNMITGATIFSKLDANSGFWQIPLNPDSQDLTTFLTPFGRFKFLKLPFGITSAPEHFQRAMSKILTGINNVTFHMDDILIWGKTKEEHDKIVRQVLDKLKTIGMTLNGDKTEFCKTEIKFLGHFLSPQGISIDSGKVSAILQMDHPCNVKELQRFNGMINFLAKFLPNKAKIIAPMNLLLQGGVQWNWGSEQQRAFDKIKQLLVSPPCLAIYDTKRETIISCDASIKGLGASLLQVQDDGSIRPISYASRVLHPAETNYANIEREATAVAWACDRFKEFIIGKTITIQTDHKPLLQLLKTKHLDDLSPRIQRIRLRLMRYDFRLSYVPGKQLTLADTLSRAPLSSTESDDYELEEESQAFVQMVLSSINLSDCNIANILEEQSKDSTLSQLKEVIFQGWPSKKDLLPNLEPFYSVKDELCVENGIILRGMRPIIPALLQPWALQRIHEGHFGITKCRLRARDSVWWPGMSSAIENMVKSCPTCIQHSSNRHEPLLTSQFPDRPWQILAMDLFKLEGVWFFIVTDYYSRYFEIGELKSLTSEEIILKCKIFFCRHGIPEEVRSDCGSQFQVLNDSEFKTFSKIYGFNHVTSSPKFPQSNGEVEAAVKIAKMILKKNTDDPYLALLAYRTTPLQNGFSPSQLLMNRRLRSTLPQTGEMLLETPDFKNLPAKEKEYRKKYKIYYDKRHHATPLSSLKVGDLVWITDMKRHGKVIGISENPRSYTVETEKRTIRRNRFNLKPAPYLQNNNIGKDTKSFPSPLSVKPKRNIIRPRWLQSYET